MHLQLIDLQSLPFNIFVNGEQKFGKQIPHILNKYIVVKIQVPVRASALQQPYILCLPVQHVYSINRMIFLSFCFVCLFSFGVNSRTNSLGFNTDFSVVNSSTKWKSW